MKKCSKCGVVKGLEAFYRDKYRVDGYSGQCKTCRTAYQREYRKNNLEKVAASQREYLKNNLEKVAAYQREYYKNNREEVAASQREYRKNNLEKSAAYQREYYKNNPKNRIRKNISEGIRRSLKSGKNGHSWEDLVGYTTADLKKHLEKKFKKGMSWENYGEWHIDHIVPVSAFNFTKPEHDDFKRCWALSNLQPLWAGENCSKSASLEKPFQPSLALE